MGDVHRDLDAAEPLRREIARMPDDDHHVLVDDDRLAPTEFLDLCHDARHRLCRVPRIAEVGRDPRQRDLLDLHSQPRLAAPFAWREAVSQFGAASLENLREPPAEGIATALWNRSGGNPKAFA
jgi:hypothetical protein